jgi:hypothetical protein
VGSIFSQDPERTAVSEELVSLRRDLALERALCGRLYDTLASLSDITENDILGISAALQDYRSSRSI